MDLAPPPPSAPYIPLTARPLAGAVALLTLTATTAQPVPNPGFYGTEQGLLERATARMCREAGARVTTNTLLTDLNIEHSTRPDAWFRFFFPSNVVRDNEMS